MDTVKLSHNDHEINPMSRRNFMIRGAMGTAGLMLFPSKLVEASSPGGWGWLLSALGSLATNVGYNLLSNYLTEWIRALTADQQRLVQMYNVQIVNRGYYNPYDYRVPVYGRSSQRCAFYPIYYPDNINGLAAFYDFCTGRYNAALAAPSVMGLQYAAKDLVNDEGFAPSEVAQTILPQLQHSASYGLFNNSYNNSDFCTTTNGSVEMNYKRTASDAGEVRVVAKRNNLRGTRTILDNTYEMNLA
jgi:hypothetical protein